MKTKFRSFSITALLLCLAMAIACLFGACGETVEDVDMTDFTYSQFAAVDEKVWDNKTISYQYAQGEFDETGAKMVDPDGAAMTIRSLNLINLYSDGTMLMYQVGVYNFDGITRYDAERYISWAFFGYWNISQDGNTMHLWYVCARSPEEPIDMTDDTWGGEDTYCFHVTAAKQDDGTFFVWNVDNDERTNTIRTLGFNNDAEEMPARENFVITSEVRFTKIQDYVDSYIWDAENWAQI